MIRTVTGAALGVQVWLCPSDSLGPDPTLFEPIRLGRNRCAGAKPEGGGLWTSSPTEWLCGWADCWADLGICRDGPLRRWLLTPESDAVLCEVDSYDDLAALHDIYGRPHWHDERELDFVAMAEAFDGMHLTDAGQWATRFTMPLNLYGWDCESTLWFRWAFTTVVDGGVVTIHGIADPA